MKDRRFLIVLVVMSLVLILGLGCGPQGLGCGSPETEGTPVTIMDVGVTPSSGTAGFQVTVGFAWEYPGPPSIPHLEPILCYYVKPNGDKVHIGDIDPRQTVGPEIIVGKGGTVQGSQTLSFNVKPEYAPADPGAYAVECYLESNPGAARKADFTVIAEETTTSSGEEQTTTTTEPATTTTEPLTFSLQEQVKIPGDGYVMVASWAGPMAVGPDGNLRATLPGTIEATVPLEVNGKHAGDYTILVTFNVQAAGSVQRAANDGRVVRIQQTVADYEVRPVTVASGNLSAGDLASCERAVREAAPKWLDKILTELTFEGAALPLTQEVKMGTWTGTVTLSQAR